MYEDQECSICHNLQEARNYIKKIGDYIVLTRTGGELKDFGLYLKGDRGIQGVIKKIADLQKFHRRYHANCDEDLLIDDIPNVSSPASEGPKRWRPPKGNNG